MSYRLEQNQGKLELWLDNGEYLPLIFDYAEDLAEFIEALVRAGQKTFLECHHVDQLDGIVDYCMKVRIATRLQLNGYAGWADHCRWVWAIQKSKLMVARDDSTGIEK